MKFNFASFVIIFVLSAPIPMGAQDYEEHSVDEVYSRIEVDRGTLDESGNSISHIFVLTDIEPGTYEIEITDGPGDLYEIKGTDYFITFRGYYGYAGYGEEGILVVKQGYYLTVFYTEE